jgi:hypothetical protein
MKPTDGDRSNLFQEPPGAEVTEPPQPAADHSDEARHRLRNPFETVQETAADELGPATGAGAHSSPESRSR